MAGSGLMSSFHLAQFNVGRLRHPLDAQAMNDFVAGLGPVNALADRTPGFVWRYTGEGQDDATGERPYGDAAIIVNFSVWETREQLWDFAYRSAHMDYLRRRREWFSRVAELDQVLWWTPAGITPTVREAMRRLDLVREQGPTAAAFTFRKFFDPPAAGSPRSGAAPEHAV
jgi:hypothetical protein